MFSNLNFWEIAGLVLLALFIFGPERLPKVISDGVRMIRQVRDMARNATADLSRELGTEVRLEDLNPKALLRKHLLSEEEERHLRRPFEQAYRDVQSIATAANDVAPNSAYPMPPPPGGAYPLPPPPGGAYPLPPPPGGQPSQDHSSQDHSSQDYSNQDSGQDYRVRPYEGQPRPYRPEPGHYDSDAT